MLNMFWWNKKTLTKRRRNDGYFSLSRGRFRNCIVDGYFFQAWPYFTQKCLPLSFIVPNCSNCPETFSYLRSVVMQEIEQKRCFRDEHASIPSIITSGDVGSSRPSIWFFLETRDKSGIWRLAHPKLITKTDVTKPG